ncbi:MAG: NUDIX domain-containing protein [Algicola sp.]|nr:NUDIX domain-containing protein [Algicola sp.]
MEELIDIVDHQGNPTGHSAPKTEIHALGHYHNTAHVWIYNAAAEILLQQRAATKTICPLLWDVSVAGHVDAGETIKAAAIREAREEIGIIMDSSELKKIGTFKCFQSYPNGIKDNEFHHTFIAKTNLTIRDMVIQKEEVEALKFVSIPLFNELLKNSKTNNHFIASNSDYYKQVIEAIILALD